MIPKVIKEPIEVGLVSLAGIWFIFTIIPIAIYTLIGIFVLYFLVKK